MFLCALSVVVPFFLLAADGKFMPYHQRGPATYVFGKDYYRNWEPEPSTQEKTGFKKDRVQDFPSYFRTKKFQDNLKRINVTNKWVVTLTDDLKARFKKLHPPTIRSYRATTCTLSYDVGQHGRLVNVKIDSSSGNADFDSRAIEFLKTYSSTHLSILPKELNLETRCVTLTGYGFDALIDQTGDAGAD